jgi:hypothetical protein
MSERNWLTTVAAASLLTWWAVLKDVGWIGVMSVIFAGTFIVSSFTVKHLRRR